jgi:hypothetical protein
MHDEIIACYPGESSKKLFLILDSGFSFVEYRASNIEHQEGLIYLQVCCKSCPMTKKEYLQYQKSVISGYYNNLDTIMLRKLGELVTELYLADTKAKKDRLWDRVHKAMVKLKVPPAIVDHIMKQKDVEVLAKNLQDWQGGKHKRKK